MKIRLIKHNSKEYPDKLNSVHKPPKRLYIRGDLDDKPAIAVVGTRKMTPYGRFCTELLVREIVRLGLVVVSGLAFGIDAVAHRTALHEKGRTIAVLGGGIDDRSIYPRAHYGLAQEILKSGGALLSEYPPRSGCRKHHFPERNRIVAGLPETVLVIEAPRKSGSMITARLALESGREVWAVPGPINHANSEGVNWLISQGATPITSVDDISAELGLASSETPLDNLSSEMRTIMETLRTESMNIDQIINKTGLATHSVGALLVELEMKGFVKNLGDGRYCVYT